MVITVNSKALRQGLRLARDVLDIASELVGKLPHKDDSRVERVAKVLAAVGVVTGDRKEDSKLLRKLVDRHNLEERVSQPFVRLFFGTALGRSFEVHRTQAWSNLDVIEAVRERDRIVFQEWRWERTQMSATFYTTPGLQLEALAARVWHEHPHGIELKVSDGGELAFTPFSIPDFPRTAVARERSALLAAEHVRLADVGEALVYLFFGPPGSGKTSTAVDMAEAAREPRLLVIDGDVVARMDLNMIAEVIRLLGPSFVLLDDLDRAPVDHEGTRILGFIRALRSSGATIVLTANDATKLSAAMLRPERIDVPVRFHAPDDAERRDLIEQVLALYGIERDVAAILAATKQMEHAYVALVVRRLRHEQLDVVARSVQLLRELSTASDDKHKPPSAAPDSPPKDPS
ncbi:MAG: AAA family ATPase [Rhodocyclaceae bacterium]|nr:MAG: AAA family ATPase [Rhodocyclaceae bacterium]